ncbi:helix-turn-helix domain-containing protein [Flexibacterium corallicola]|uniref:helix-turn-helix domain-containing protein n=1 Tax=Flexibacterium corallicola TaxID=3037259 RepID=UPI00286F3540|nr:helix-turn-helix transcriptional regulator [Pseudovibrio sp. M1P-2-3]
MTTDTTETWRDRLVAAIEGSDKTYRAISAECGKAPAYIQQMIKMNKEPSISTALRICEVINVSPAYILLGLNLSNKADDFLRVFNEIPEGKQDYILDFLTNMLNDNSIEK